jgi:hypothetical protein
VLLSLGLPPHRGARLLLDLAPSKLFAALRLTPDRLAAALAAALQRAGAGPPAGAAGAAGLGAAELAARLAALAGLALPAGLSGLDLTQVGGTRDSEERLGSATRTRDSDTRLGRETRKCDSDARAARCAPPAVESCGTARLCGG